MTDNAELLRAAMDKRRVTDNTLRAAIAAIAMGESGLDPRSETSYHKTSNARIREIFRSRVADLSEEQLTALKSNDVEFFNRVYGGEWGKSHLGNTHPGDGYRYRGRGLFQLTGRENYAHFGTKIGRPEIVDNPDLANDPAIAAEIAVAYMVERYKGGGWEGMKRAVGNSVGNVDARKDRLFREYVANGEFSARHIA